MVDVLGNLWHINRPKESYSCSWKSRSGGRGLEIVDPQDCHTANRSRTVAIALGLTVTLLGLLWWFDPAKSGTTVCMFHAMTGLNCPGCGATRATHELLHGRLAAAWHYNALWVTILPLVVYAAVSELRVMTDRRPLPGDLPRQPRFWIATAVAAGVFFVVRNFL